MESTGAALRLHAGFIRLIEGERRRPISLYPALRVLERVAELVLPGFDRRLWVRGPISPVFATPAVWMLYYIKDAGGDTWIVSTW